MSVTPLFLLLAALEGLPFFDSRELTPYWPDQTQSFQPAQVSAFQALDQEGRPISESTMKEGISIVNFFFAECPGICPLMMQSMKKFQRNLTSIKGKVRIYSFSVTPDRDTPEKLLAYAKAFQIDARDWKLLTGDRKVIYHVGKEMFKADGAVGAQKKDDAFIHTQNAYLLDGDLRIRGIYDTGNSEAMKLLAKDAEQLIEKR
jgi:protein SCO1/2